jgi:hypothetical protein
LIFRKLAWLILTKVFRDAPYITAYSSQVKGVNYTIVRLDDYLSKQKEAR